MMLWTFENVTHENFPLTYEMAWRAIERTKDNEKSLFAMASDLLRYETVLKYGGIYFDFKHENKKSFNEWRKYEILFTDCEVTDLRIGSPKFIGQGIVGGVKGNEYLKILLTEILFSERMIFDPKITIPSVTGGHRLR